MKAASNINPLVGKWKLVESLGYINKLAPLRTGRKGEVVRFTEDGRKQTAGERPSRGFGEVVYKLAPGKNPPQIDTAYECGEKLRRGIYRLENDRLTICSQHYELGPRPGKFEGFTLKELKGNRNLVVDTYERVGNANPKVIPVPALKRTIKPPRVRLASGNKVRRYLEAGKGRKMPGGSQGIASEWMPFAEIENRSGFIWAGDPCGLDANEGCEAKLPTGPYLIEAQGMDFGGFRILARIRIVAKIAGRGAKLGGEVAETGTDSAAVAICDLRTLKAALGGEEEVLEREAAKPAPPAGSITSKKLPGVILPYVASGFGDGTGPVYQLRARGKRVGIELDFLPHSAW